MTRGVRQIVRLNGRFYVLGTATVLASAAAADRWPLDASARMAVHFATVLAAFWIVSSLAASWIVYDRSDLMRWEWIARTLRRRPASWINLHAGLDESTPALRTLLGGGNGRVFDIFDAAEMTEPSIARARQLARNEIVAEPADYRHLPVATGTIDAALLLLSAHELRSDDARGALFVELQRVLGRDGRVIVAEHLRNWANFVAFGPGFLHFHSRRAWMRAFARAPFAIDEEFSITPLVRVFVLRRLP